ncbi:unnamed protein product [Vicia faba]|uniref:Uncharacterized protein n=1 Tax=Vicia faba TaxID=3906 RepID=A0AAV1ARU8_VICFA|nr:unnamed protein product [Vicia faba]
MKGVGTAKAITPPNRNNSDREHRPTSTHNHRSSDRTLPPRDPLRHMPKPSHGYPSDRPDRSHTTLRSALSGANHAQPTNWLPFPPSSLDWCPGAGTCLYSYQDHIPACFPSLEGQFHCLQLLQCSSRASLLASEDHNHLLNPYHDSGISGQFFSLAHRIEALDDQRLCMRHVKRKSFKEALLEESRRQREFGFGRIPL